MTLWNSHPITKWSEIDGFLQKSPICKNMLWCQSLTHHHLCARFPHPPYNNHFLIPLVKALLLVIRTYCIEGLLLASKLSEKNSWTDPSLVGRYILASTATKKEPVLIPLIITLLYVFWGDCIDRILISLKLDKKLYLQNNNKIQLKVWAMAVRGTLKFQHSNSVTHVTLCNSCDSVQSLPKKLHWVTTPIDHSVCVTYCLSLPHHSPFYFCALLLPSYSISILFHILFAGCYALCSLYSPPLLRESLEFSLWIPLARASLSCVVFI